MGFNSARIAKRTAALSVPERHRLKVARRTMEMNCTFARIMGGMNGHHEAANVIHELTGVIVGINFPCTCPR